MDVVWTLELCQNVKTTSMQRRSDVVCRLGYAKTDKIRLLHIYCLVCLEMVQDAVIPISVLGIEYIGGPVVSILSSKQSSMYFPY